MSRVYLAGAAVSAVAMLFGLFWSVGLLLGAVRVPGVLANVPLALLYNAPYACAGTMLLVFVSLYVREHKSS